MKEATEGEKQSCNCRDHSSVGLSLVRRTSNWIGHTQGKGSDLLPQETNLMESAARKVQSVFVEGV